MTRSIKQVVFAILICVSLSVWLLESFLLHIWKDLTESTNGGFEKWLKETQLEGYLDLFQQKGMFLLQKLENLNEKILLSFMFCIKILKYMYYLIEARMNNFFSTYN